MTQDAFCWVSIPATDIDRAQRFYETLLACSLQRQQNGPQTIALFPSGEGRVGGGLFHGPGVPAPSTDGPIAYVQARPSVDVVLGRAGELGATVLMPKFELPGGAGIIAQIVDSEGNRLGLWAPAAA